MSHLQLKFESKYADDKRHPKVRDHCQYTGKHRGVGNNTCNLIYSIPKEMRMIFYNGLNYGYHFVITELVKEFIGILELEFIGIGKNAGKYLTFSFPIKKEIEKTNENGKEITKSISNN